MRRNVFVAAIVTALALPATAGAANVTFEGESMTWGGNGQQLADSTAWNGQAFQNWNNGEGYRDVTLTGGVAALFARVRAEQCPRKPDGSAATEATQFEIQVDGKTVPRVTWRTPPTPRSGGPSRSARAPTVSRCA